MSWRTTAFALTLSAAAWAGEPKANPPKWLYARLVDAPLAPTERSTPGKIVKVSATEKTEPASAKLVADVAVDPQSQSWRVFVGGEVLRPGAFNAQKRFTALQAVLAAGGLKDAASAGDVVVLRYQKSDAPPTAQRVDLTSTLAGKSVNDLWLESHDVVIVPKAGKPLSTEEIAKAVPLPVQAAAKSRLVEVHRLKTPASGIAPMRPVSKPGK
jgi:hypothetical protein